MILTPSDLQPFLAMTQLIPRRLVALGLLLSCAVLTYARQMDTGPWLVRIAPVRADLLALYIQEGEVDRSRIVPYLPEPGDVVEEKGLR